MGEATEDFFLPSGAKGGEEGGELPHRTAASAGPPAICSLAQAVSRSDAQPTP